ncbi:hypothetical protein [uncultured Chloroflexus sp.]|uniref:hypothetical protein n=1 Tax=uncultured Chloroflexus sp. TaxID=214040 RepID=UPI0026126A06|nr:hypothetical protein [uncultured Chloroflexus sp.]
MYTSLAHSITLAARGNAALTAPAAVNPGDVYPDNLAFRSGEYVRFAPRGWRGSGKRESRRYSWMIRCQTLPPVVRRWVLAVTVPGCG